MTNDGTQDPLPPPVLSDPLAGLVTGARYEPDTLRVHVAGAAMPDISAVRKAMAAVLDEDSELDLGSIAPADEFFSDSQDGGSASDAQTTQATQQPAEQAPAEPPAEAPTAVQPVAPARSAPPPRSPATRAPTPPTGIPAPRMPGDRTRLIRLPRRGPKLPPRVKGKEHSSAGSVTLIMVLLLVMAVLAIVFLASLVESIASLFG